ncbi:Hypothetical_protein [Hexamita inflata]|uniref:Hypothetical_protein n=1 Tax=Hexamita inflata TaxID=28002 RepID=A0AA86QX17_9EUKA|nr:Hypothetical protein HINF_LOCUS53810 [Hexamita inflata]
MTYLTEILSTKLGPNLIIPSQFVEGWHWVFLDSISGFSGSCQTPSALPVFYLQIINSITSIKYLLNIFIYSEQQLNNFIQRQFQYIWTKQIPKHNRASQSLKRKLMKQFTNII